MLDKPFNGTMVPYSCFKRGDRRCQAIMIELRRDIYMNEATGAKLEPDFERLQAVLKELLCKLEHFVTEGVCQAWHGEGKALHGSDVRK